MTRLYHSLIIVLLLLFLVPQSVSAFPRRLDLGEFAYLFHPEKLMRAIRSAEGVPSYGLMWLAEKYGGHENVPWQIGRREAGKLVHRIYKRWVERGRPGTFFSFLANTWAPIGADNDPTGLNRHWAENVALTFAMQFVEDDR